MDIEVLIVVLLVLILGLGIALWMRPPIVAEESPVIVRNIYPSDWAWGGGWGWPRFYGGYWGGGGGGWHHGGGRWHH